jgi:hypothetical protein
MSRAISKKYNPEYMAARVESYVNECLKKKEVPIFLEVVVKEKWNRVYAERLRGKEGYDDYAEAVDRLFAAKEYMLERLSLNGKKSTTQAIFSLKQLGWRDNQTIDFGGQKDNALNVTIKIAE